MIKNPLRKVIVATALALPAVSLTIQSALAEDLVFTLKNQSSSPLVEFYVEATSENNWGENLLTEAVGTGEQGEVKIADGRRTCTYDILGVFEDGSKLDERDVNLCELGSYTYTDKQ